MRHLRETEAAKRFSSHFLRKLRGFRFAVSVRSEPRVGKILWKTQVVKEYGSDYSEAGRSGIQKLI